MPPHPPTTELHRRFPHKEYYQNKIIIGWYISSYLFCFVYKICKFLLKKMAAIPIDKSYKVRYNIHNPNMTIIRTWHQWLIHAGVPQTLVRDPMMQSAQPWRQPCAGCALYSEIFRKDKLRMKNQFGDKFPDDVVNALARMLLPEIQKAYESAEGQAE